MDKVQAMKGIKLFLFDMDGTLYLGNRLYPFTMDLLKTMRENGCVYRFLTNNSSKSIADYVEKLKRMGIMVTREDFLTSSQATAYYLKQHHSGKTLYVCGTNSLKEELRGQGFSVTDNAEEAQCIVMGFDTELTFKKLEDVSRTLSTRDIPYIATNPDLVCPTEFGSVPDCGSVCEMIFNATGKRPVVIGKPSALMIQLAMENAGYTKEETCVVGDRIYTDVKCGLNAGVTSILVLSGETTQEILDASEDKPHIVLPDASGILEAIK